MKTARICIFWLFLALLSFAMMIIGCTKYVKLDATRYTPNLGDGLERYRGTAVYVSITKDVPYSWDWGYPSDYSKVYYWAENDSIEAYFLECFEAAFNSVGATVYKTPNGTSAHLSVKLTDLTDMIYVANVRLENKFKVFSKSSVIAWPPQKKWDPQVFEQNAYQMMNKLLRDILKDPNFQRIYFEDP